MIRIFPKRFEVNPNQIGFLYKNKKLKEKLEPGIYLIFDPLNRIELINSPTYERMSNIINQEVLTKDNIALRFSFVVQYKIINAEIFLSKFEYNKNIFQTLFQLDQVISNLYQLKARKEISLIDSEFLNEKRKEIENLKDEEVDIELNKYGIEVSKAQIKDITFPKNIQTLFAQQLESKIRAKADLENARTTVATARALKNASELMKGDDSILFVQYLETITKIASKGKHTFMIGDIPKFGKENN